MPIFNKHDAIEMLGRESHKEVHASSSSTGPDVAVILVNYNTAHLLPEAMTALRHAASKLSVRTILVDNASRDGSVALIRSSFSDCALIANDVNVGFGRANNQALPLAAGRYVLLLNTDAFVLPDTLEKTVNYMDAHPRCGILGVKLVGRDGALQPCARYFPTPLNLFLARTGLNRVFKGVRMVDDMAWDHASARSCDWVPGCYYLVRREVIDQVGLFDPRYFLYYEEVDHCFAARKAGWDVVCYPDTTVVHIGGESAKSEGPITQTGRQIEALQMESELLFFRKNHGVIGAWLNVLLTTLGDAIIAAKRLLKRRSSVGTQNCASHVALLWSLFRRTAWGTRPTR
jgi:N-acetylglucosaminyl-diphospho-decaprenol L-rhamnosyltransferase